LSELGFELEKDRFVVSEENKAEIKIVLNVREIKSIMNVHRLALSSGQRVTFELRGQSGLVGEALRIRALPDVGAVELVYTPPDEPYVVDASDDFDELLKVVDK
jgi:hypothetical protein